MGVTTEVSSLTYGESDWEHDSYTLLAERSDPQPCPHCGRTGFYGPRAMDPGRKFRACRFCGFSQEIGQEPVFMHPVVHGCSGWPEVAKAPYVWWTSPSDKWFTCPFCQQRAPVDAPNAFLKGVRVKSPLEERDHAWWRVPQGRPYAFYLRFWENWAFTKGRVVL